MSFIGGKMNLNVRGIHFSVDQDTTDFLDKKLQKLDFAQDYLQDLDIVIKKETSGQAVHLDAQLHFRWGTVKQVSYDSYEVFEGIEMLVDKIESVTKKEKSKVIEK